MDLTLTNVSLDKSSPNKVSSEGVPGVFQDSDSEFIKECFVESEGRALVSVKSTLRLKYEAEAQEIINRYGDLEQIREKLGMTQRRICELILVDPSAWTRWTKGATGVPPHVYKTLSLLLERGEGLPKSVVLSDGGLRELRRQPSERQVSRESQTSQLVENLIESKVEARIGEIDEKSKLHFSSLRTLIEKSEKITLGWKFLLLINILLVLYAIFK